jgi:uncharacterized protein YcfJ
MKNYSFFALAVFAAASASAQEVGRVISSTPVIQQVSVPRQACGSEVVPGQKSGAGALMGAIAGGAAGNAIGNGSGRAAATVLGLFGGAILGDRIEGGGQPQTVQRCSTQNFIENRTVAYNVVYEYGGKQYQVQMPNDPGPTVALQITPIGANPPPVQAPPPAQVQPVPQSMYAPVPGWPQAQYVEPVYVVPPPVVYQTVQPYPYRAPFATSISISGGRYYGHRPYGGHWVHDGHWR